MFRDGAKKDEEKQTSCFLFSFPLSQLNIYCCMQKLWYLYSSDNKYHFFTKNTYLLFFIHSLYTEFNMLCFIFIFS